MNANKLVVRNGRGRELTTKGPKDTKNGIDELSNRVIGCAMEVQRELGPGLLESAYAQGPPFA